VLDHTLKIVSPRFANHRQRYEVHACFPKGLQSWWRECLVGFVEPLEISLEDREQNNVAARALVWEMEGFSARWGRPAVGLMGFWVRPDLRRQGIGKFLLSHLLRQVQDQYFELAEVHIASDNLPALQFLQSLAFQQVDTGQVFLRHDNA
jgi:ribosomal protein S18 acetylase RimI-like enzyme